MSAGQLLAVAAIITSITALVTAVAGLVKMLGELRQLRSTAAATHTEVSDVKALVNGNHADLVARLDAVTVQRDEARGQLRERDHGPG